MEKQLNRGKILKKIPDNLKDSYTSFMESVKNKRADMKYKVELQEIIKSLNINYDYRDTSTAVEDILENINNLLVQLGFVESMADAEKNNKGNKSKISSFAGERLNVIQLKPYKSGAALVVFVEKRKK